MKIANKEGFSLMELVIIIAIIGIMTAVGLVSLNSGKNQKQVETEARKVISVIREAQNNALSGKSIGSGRYPCSFEVSLAPGSDTGKYSASYIYKNSVAETCASNSVSSTYGNYNLSNGVVFSSAASDINFSAPFGGVASSTSIPLLITLSKGDFSFNFCVCPLGKIVENGGCGDC